MESISGKIVDIINSQVYSGTIQITNGIISDIIYDNKNYENFIIPGFIDAHIHIESSMLPPSEFARIAAIHGTVATVSDPHEIANVLGMAGIRFMIDNAAQVPFKFYFSAPSCVPATAFETSGHAIGVNEIEELLKQDDIKYLGEMMNYPGVIFNDPIVLAKINLAKKYKKPIDGHAPGLSKVDLHKYIDSGISTDHESFRINEAKGKIELGMKILIREGSAAKNFDELIPLADQYSEKLMFCSDDKHPDDLIAGHINLLVKRAIENGIDPLKVLRIATLNPIEHYKLDVGLLRVGDSADFLEIDNFENLTIRQTVVKGQIISKDGKSLLKRNPPDIKNNFQTDIKLISDFAIKPKSENLKVIKVIDGQLITEKISHQPKIINGNLVSDIDHDLLKLTVVNRYENTQPALGFVKNFGIKKGAIASSVAHDSHNIVAIGGSDEEICRAVNLVIRNKGGLCAVSVEDSIDMILPLPIAGLMSAENYSDTARKYQKLDSIVKQFGSLLTAPFMTLSFLALLVIPELKLSDQGLFDGSEFKFVSLFEE